jgi:hypothetical protein
LTSQSICILIGPQSTLTEIVPSSDQPSTISISSPFSFLPRWDAKMIEVIGHDVDDIYSGKQTRSQNQHDSVSLMTRVLETCDHVNYSDAQGKLEWEQSM